MSDECKAYTHSHSLLLVWSLTVENTVNSLGIEQSIFSKFKEDTYYDSFVPWCSVEYIILWV